MRNLVRKLIAVSSLIIVITLIVTIVFSSKNKEEGFYDEMAQNKFQVDEQTLSTKQVLNDVINQLETHVSKFNDEDLLFFAPKLPDNFELKIEVNDLGKVYLKVKNKEKRYSYNDKTISFEQ